MGHRVVVGDAMGSTQSIMVTAAGLFGSSDPRTPARSRSATERTRGQLAGAPAPVLGSRRGLGDDEGGRPGFPGDPVEVSGVAGIDRQRDHARTVVAVQLLIRAVRRSTSSARVLRISTASPACSRAPCHSRSRSCRPAR